MPGFDQANRAAVGAYAIAEGVARQSAVGSFRRQDVDAVKAVRQIGGEPLHIFQAIAKQRRAAWQLKDAQMAAFDLPALDADADEVAGSFFGVIAEVPAMGGFGQLVVIEKLIRGGIAGGHGLGHRVADPLGRLGHGVIVIANGAFAESVE